MRLAILFAGLLMIQGCAVQATRYAVSAYCAVPNPARIANRILINAAIAPNSVAVTCAEGVANE